MSDWDFGQLDLEDSEVDSGNVRLKAGRYICNLVEATLEPTKSDKNGRTVKCVFVDRQGNGSITEYINIHLPGKKQATDIGKKQLKTLLTHGGHPTPNAPGDIKSLVGLVVGVNVITEPFQSKKEGEGMIDGSAVDSWHPYFNPEGAVGLGPKVVQAPAAKPDVGTIPDDGFDDIPF